MSYSTLQAIWPGEKYENVREFANSHGTAPIVWTEFCVRYLHEDPYWWLFNASKPDCKLWKCWKDTSIPEGHRAVLMFTFDHFYVEKKDYHRFAADLRSFLDSTKISANHANHWPLIAQFFEMEPQYPAVALWCTSVTSDPYEGTFDEEKDAYGPFDWSKCYSVYEQIDQLGVR